MLSFLLPHPAALFAVMVAGILLLYVEANRPGRVIPGCAGLLLILAALPVLCTPPIRIASAVLLVAGFALTTLQAWSPIRWLLTVPGVAAMAVGIARFYRDWPQPSPLAAVLLASVLGVSTSSLATIALQARRAKRHTIH